MRDGIASREVDTLSGMARVPLSNPRRWRRRAERIRAMVDRMTDTKSKRIMMRIAGDYEQMARRATELAERLKAIEPNRRSDRSDNH
jgi:hypothetical protein